ncbi:MAG: hypothetical protein JHD16_12095 [Solirubrobacteraceae bacterium]|nr:hypothetical protein [Solirubrobacteraceae bacterium]
MFLSPVGLQDLYLRDASLRDYARVLGSKIGFALTALVATLISLLSASGAQARSCVPLALGAPAHHGTSVGPEVDCFSIDLPAATAAGKTSLLIGFKGRTAKLVLVGPSGNRVCAQYPGHPTQDSARVYSCEVDAAGTYRLDVRAAGAPSSVPSPYSLAVQDRDRPQRCRALGGSPAQTLTGTTPGPGFRCFSFRVGPRGMALDLRGDYRASLEVVDGSGSRLCRLESRYELRDCRIGPGRYTLLVATDSAFSSVDSSFQATFRPFAKGLCEQVPAPPSAYVAYHDSSGWAGLNKGRFTKGRVECRKIEPSYAGSEWLFAVHADGPGRTGLRVRRPDGSTLCSSSARTPMLCRFDVAGSHTIETWYSPAPGEDGSPAYTLAVQPGFGSGYWCTNVTAPGAWAGQRAHAGDPSRCYRAAIRQDGLVLERPVGAARVKVFNESTGAEVCTDPTQVCRLENRANYTFHVTGEAGRWRVVIHAPTRTARPASCDTVATLHMAYDDAPLQRSWQGQQRDCVRFRGAAYDRVTAAVAWTGDARPAKRILRSDGTEVCRGGSWQPLLCTLDQSGIFYLESSGNQAGSSAVPTPYRVSVKRIALASYVAVSNGCTPHDRASGAQSTNVVRQHNTDLVSCNVIHDRRYNVRNWTLRIRPGKTTVRVLDGYGEPICEASQSSAVTTCTVPTIAYVLISGSAGSATLSYPR